MVEVELLDTPEGISYLVNSIIKLKDQTPLFLQLEGTNLGRHGRISLIAFVINGDDRILVIDVTVLQNKAFDTKGDNGVTVRHILEGSEIKKSVFDVGTASDALFHLYKISLDGIQDIQILEFAARSPPKDSLRNLRTCIHLDAGFNHSQNLDYRTICYKANRLSVPEYGGSSDSIHNRPIDIRLMALITAEVGSLPTLWTTYDNSLSPDWKTVVDKDTAMRVQVSKSRFFCDRHTETFWSTGPYYFSLANPLAALSRIEHLCQFGPDRVYEQHRARDSLSLLTIGYPSATNDPTAAATTTVCKTAVATTTAATTTTATTTDATTPRVKRSHSGSEKPVWPSDNQETEPSIYS